MAVDISSTRKDNHFIERNRVMNRSYLCLLLGAAMACAAACSSDPKPQPASAFDQTRRPLMLPSINETTTPTLTQIHIDPAITAACNMPTPHFDFDSTAIKGDAGLDALASCFTTGPMKGHTMSLVGHADPRGETEYNFGLGQRRAGEIENYLHLRGVGDSRVSTSSRGELDATGSDEAGWAEDRRVDIVLGRTAIPSEGAMPSNGL